jgi:hypothetical protein
MQIPYVHHSTRVRLIRTPEVLYSILDTNIGQHNIYFPQSLQAVAGTVSQKGHDPVLTDPLILFIQTHLPILLYVCVLRNSEDIKYAYNKK